MALEFNSKPIPGTTLSIVYGAAEPQLRRARFWKAIGEIEVAGETGGRDVLVTHILHNSFAKHADLLAEIRKLDGLVLQNGTLNHSTGSGSTLQRSDFRNTTFEGYQQQALGSEQVGPLKDLAGTLLNADGSADGGWFVTLALKFHQLVVI